MACLAAAHSHEPQQRSQIALVSSMSAVITANDWNTALGVDVLLEATAKQGHGICSASLEIPAVQMLGAFVGTANRKLFLLFWVVYFYLFFGIFRCVCYLVSCTVNPELKITNLYIYSSSLSSVGCILCQISCQVNCCSPIKWLQVQWAPTGVYLTNIGDMLFCFTWGFHRFKGQMFDVIYLNYTIICCIYCLKLQK